MFRVNQPSNYIKPSCRRKLRPATLKMNLTQLHLNTYRFSDSRLKPARTEVTHCDCFEIFRSLCVSARGSDSARLFSHIVQKLNHKCFVCLQSSCLHICLSNRDNRLTPFFVVTNPASFLFVESLPSVFVETKPGSL